MLIFQMHIFKQQLQKFINGQCITSEKNTVWKHPCYFVSKYKTSTNKLLQSSKKSFSLFFFFFSCFFSIFVLFLLDKTQFSHWVPQLMTVLHHFTLLKDPGTCKPRSGGAKEAPVGLSSRGLSQGWEGLWVIHVGHRRRWLGEKLKHNCHNKHGYRI